MLKVVLYFPDSPLIVLSMVFWVVTIIIGLYKYVKNLIPGL